MSAFASPAAVPRFPTTVSFADTVAGEGWAELRRTEGAGRWAMPLCLWNSPGGVDASGAGTADHYTLAFVTSGAGVEGRRGRRLGDIPPGPGPDFGLQPAHLATDYRSRGPIRFAHLYFTDAFLRAAGGELFGERADRPDLLRHEQPFITDHELRAMADAYLLAGLGARHPSTALEMDSRAALIGTHLLRGHSTIAPLPEARRMALAPLALSRAKEYLEAHLGEDFSLAAVAAAAGLSPFYFARAFRREAGVAPHRYLMERRVARARDLLAGTDLPLAEVALVCGFAGQSHFTTAFKRHTQMTPGAWRAAMRI